MTDTAELAAIHRAILSEPAEDTHRLALADWLDERGEPGDADTAWFIRTQIASGADGVFTLSTSNVYGHDFKEGSPYPVVWGADPKPRDLANIAATFRHWSLILAGRFQYQRGFLHSITCSSADWIANHEKLYWHPGQTVECEACKGVGGSDEYRGNQDWGWASCPMCDSTGCFSRPYQSTAHPIRSVILTTHPDTMKLYELCRKNGMGESPGNRIAKHIEILEAEWKGVTFTLPNTPLDS